VDKAKLSLMEDLCS